MDSKLWNSLTTTEELEALLDLFGGFHDGCLREAHVWTQHWVRPDLSMCWAGDLDTRLRLLVQRQFQSPSAIELLFEQVITFHLQPSPPNSDSIIYSATLTLDSGTFYWADTSGWSRLSAGRDSATWIAAKKLSWRDASDWMGPQLRYGPPDPAM